METSPAQHLTGHGTCILLQTHQNLLKPQEAEEIKTELENTWGGQKRMYNRGSHPLPPLNPGQPVCMKLPGSNSVFSSDITNYIS